VRVADRWRDTGGRGEEEGENTCHVIVFLTSGTCGGEGERVEGEMIQELLY